MKLCARQCEDVETMRPIYRAIARFATLLLLAAAFASHAKEPDVLGPDTWPKTLDAAVTVAIQQLPPAKQARLKAMKREDLIRLHQGTERDCATIWAFGGETRI
ncbi:MAG: hypothetical protein FWG56_10080 [Desulfovibrionaceae bacterium]|nr:hypothetical protein [Desulfovibrionaceae bacterium]